MAEPSPFDDAQIEITGRLHIELRGPDGALKDERDIDNLVVTTGKNLIANRMQTTPTFPAIGWMELGTGVTAAAIGDTTLQTVIAASRTALTSATVTNNAIAMVCSFGPGVGTGAVTEAGTFNAAAAGTMLGHTVFSVINKGASDTMTITWTTTIS